MVGVKGGEIPYPLCQNHEGLLVVVMVMRPRREIFVQVRSVLTGVRLAVRPHRVIVCIDEAQVRHGSK